MTLREQCRLRPIRPGDDRTVAGIIRTVMSEFGADGPGYAIVDAEVDGMFGAYSGPQSRYWVVEREARVLGGGGFAPLQGGQPGVCELRKMYFLPELRGLGLGQQLLELVLSEAKRAGFTGCYVETLERMRQARRLYEAHGFRPLSRALGNTGHFSCDARYFIDLP